MLLGAADEKTGGPEKSRENGLKNADE